MAETDPPVQGVALAAVAVRATAAAPAAADAASRVVRDMGLLFQERAWGAQGWGTAWRGREVGAARPRRGIRPAYVG
ncbi:hypothetical protein GCM10022221_25700 [Actinocorallia aurea]